MTKNQNLIWVDLEMTGLDPQKDKILEVAVVITNNNLEVVADGLSLVLHEPEEQLVSMHDEIKKLHKTSGLWERVLESRITAYQAEQQVLEYLERYCLKNSSPLCGNSVWVDRFFLKMYMPKFYDFLHYRTIDVSTVKELVSRWASHEIPVFEKAKTHRALDDIKESIEELKYYRNKLFLFTR